MNIDNTVKIGTALKWRSSFDPDKRYYQENIVTACGCVFRCKVLQTQGCPPVQTIDENGHLGFANVEVWDVIVDMIYYYNFAVDTKKMTEETLVYVKSLDEAIANQQKEINEIKDDDLSQWKEINRINEVDKDQQENIDILLDSLSNLEVQHNSDIENISARLDAGDKVFDEVIKQNARDHSIMQEHLEVLDDCIDDLTHDITDIRETASKELESISSSFEKMEQEHEDFKTVHEDLKKEHAIFEEKHQDYEEQLKFMWDQYASPGLWDNDSLWNNAALWESLTFPQMKILLMNLQEENESLKKQIIALQSFEEEIKNTPQLRVMDYDEETATIIL